jgi:DNA-directed RNA polymerase specialized sigma24 family protein
VAAVARRELPAAERFFSAHVDRLYGLFRLCLDTQAEAESALTGAFSRASDGIAQLQEAGDQAAWLMDLALEELAVRWAAADPLYPESLSESAIHASPTFSLSQVSDTALAVLIRTLEPRRRQALVLTAVYGLEPARVAATLNVSEGQAAALARVANVELAAELHEHERKQSQSAALVAETSHQLRPLPEPAAEPGNPLIFAMRQAKERFLDWLPRPHHGHDEVGGTSERARRPEATPTTQPFDSPKLTPTLGRYSQPPPTPGTPSHRAPKGTPSTKRISGRRALNPSPALPFRQRRDKG